MIFFIGLLLLLCLFINNNNLEINNTLKDIKDILNYLEKNNKNETKQVGGIKSLDNKEYSEWEEWKENKGKFNSSDLYKIKNDLLDIKTTKNKNLQSKLKKQFKDDYIKNATIENYRLFDDTLNKKLIKENNKKIDNIIDKYKNTNVINKEMFKDIKTETTDREILLNETNIDKIVERLNGILGESNKKQLTRAWENMCINKSKKNEFDDLKLDLNDKIGDLVPYNDKLENTIYNLEPYVESETEEFGSYC